MAPSGGAWTTNTVLTITTTTGTPTGTYAFAVRATPSGGGAAATALSTLVVNFPTTTSVNSSANPVIYGQAVTFTVTVVPSGPGTPTGSVTLLDGATSLGSSSLDAAGQTTFSLSNLNVAGSPHSITAVYSGDSTFQGSTSAAVSQASTATSLTVTGITGVSKTYDGTTVAALDFSGALLVGMVNGDVVSLNTSTTVGAFADKNVGIGKPVALTVALSGPDSGNYSLLQPAATASITPKELTVSGIAVANKVYDGTTTASLIKSGATLVGVISPDVVTLSTAGATAAFADKNVGISKPVTISGLTISGTDAANYTLAQTYASASITPATLTVKADDKIKVVGIANPALTATCSGFVAGEDASVLTSQATLATTADISSPAGDYPIVASGAAAPNYQISYLNGVLSVLLPPVLTATQLEGNLFIFKFDTVLEQRYQVEACDSLPAATWSPIGLVLTGTGQSLSVTNDISGGNKFFRVEALPRAR